MENIFQDNSIAKKHKDSFETMLLNNFLLSFTGVFESYDKKYLKGIDRLVDLSKSHEYMDLGYIYFLSLNGKYKIGRTKSIVNRLNSYESNSGRTPKLLCLQLFNDHKDKENKLKKILNSNSNNFEWFENLEITETIDIIKKL